MNKIALSAALLIATATAGAAAEWHHASAPMGQYEGQLRVSDVNMIAYACSLSSSVDFVFEGSHEGPVAILVDGKGTVMGQVAPGSDGKTSVVEFRVENESPKSAKFGHNYLIHALAEGGEVSIVQGDQTLASWPLEGSSKITNCAVFIER